MDTFVDSFKTRSDSGILLNVERERRVCLSKVVETGQTA